MAGEYPNWIGAHVQEIGDMVQVAANAPMLADIAGAAIMSAAFLVTGNPVALYCALDCGIGAALEAVLHPVVEGAVEQAANDVAPADEPAVHTVTWEESVNTPTETWTTGQQTSQVDEAMTNQLDQGMQM